MATTSFGFSAAAAAQQIPNAAKKTENFLFIGMQANFYSTGPAHGKCHRTVTLAMSWASRIEIRLHSNEKKIFCLLCRVRNLLRRGRGGKAEAGGGHRGGSDRKSVV